MDILEQARGWQQMKQYIALQLAGSHEANQALADSKKIGALADEIERLRRGEFICRKCGLRKDADHDGPPDF